MENIKTELSFSETIRLALDRQGRKQVWLAKEMGVTTQTIYNKLKNNEWTVSEKIALKSILNLD
jgi:DNA-binding XRE family transcriptional regulator